jgi:hypothetical protein
MLVFLPEELVLEAFRRFYNRCQDPKFCQRETPFVPRCIYRMILIVAQDSYDIFVWRSYVASVSISNSPHTHWKRDPKLCRYSKGAKNLQEIQRLWRRRSYSRRSGCIQCRSKIGALRESVHDYLLYFSSMSAKIALVQWSCLTLTLCCIQKAEKTIRIAGEKMEEERQFKV